MMSHSRGVISLLVGLFLLIGVCPARTFARNNGEDVQQPVRLRSAPLPAPIGTVHSMARGALLVNGRPVWGQHFIWAGDLIENNGSLHASVQLGSAGRATLIRSTVARFGSLCEVDDRQRVVLLTLLRGKLKLDLAGDSSARIQAGGRRFASSAGARFGLQLRDSEPILTATRGTVSLEPPASQGRYNMATVGHSSEIKVKTGDLFYIRIRVTDGQNRPLPEMPLLFTLEKGVVVGTLGLGTLAGNTFITLTNAEGVASVPFLAGRKSGITTITAFLEATGVSWTGQIEVIRSSNVARNILIGIGAGAAIGAGIAIAARDTDDDVTALPPVIRP